MLELLLRCLDASPWTYNCTESGELWIAFSSDRAAWRGSVWIEEELGYLVIYGLCPVVASEKRLPRMLEMVARINFGLPVGVFELDLENGETRLRTGLHLNGLEPDADLLNTLLADNAALMDRYLPAILQTIYTDRPIQDILDEIETEEEPGEESGETPEEEA